MASGSRSITKGSDSAFMHECDVCKYNNKTVEAISFCTVCTEYLCDACDQTHKGSKATRGHKIVTGSKMPSSTNVSKPVLPIMLCEHHKTMTLNVYCVSHDCAICGTCKLTDHRKCQTTDVTQQTKGLKIESLFDEAVKRITDLKKKCEKLEESRTRDKGKVKSEINRCLEEMRKIRRKINGVLDGLEQKLTQEASNVEDSMTEDIKSHVTIADDALNQIEDQIKSFGECRKSRDNDVMFVGMKKADALQNKYEAAISTVEQGIYPIQIEFKPNDVITDVLLQLESLGTLQTKRNISHRIQSGLIQSKKYSSTAQSHVSVIHINASNRRDIDVRSCVVFDTTFIDDIHIVLACGSDGLKLLDKHFKVQSRIPVVSSLRVATINNKQVIVTQGDKKKLQIVKVFPTMSATKTVDMDRACWGVYVHHNEIYVTCHDDPGNGEIRVLDLQGNPQRTIGMSGSTYIFKAPSHITVSRDGTNMFVSDWKTDKVTCVDQQGDVQYEYEDSGLVRPGGVWVDEEDNVMVCGESSNNVHIINRDGTKHRVVLSERDGVKFPWCLSYRPGDGCLVVGLGGWPCQDKALLVFDTKAGR